MWEFWPCLALRMAQSLGNKTSPLILLQEQLLVCHKLLVCCRDESEQIDSIPFLLKFTLSGKEHKRIDSSQPQLGAEYEMSMSFMSNICYSRRAPGGRK